MFLSEYTLMPLCTRSIEPAFHVRETGSSLGTAPALQNRLPPLGSNYHIRGCVPVPAQFGTSASYVYSGHCAPREKSLLLCVVAMRGESSRVYNLRYRHVSSLRLNGVTFTPGPVCSARAGGGFKFSLGYPQYFCSHLN